MYMLQMELTDEGGEMLKDLARRAGLQSPEHFIAQAMELFGAGVQLEEMGGSVVGHYPDGRLQQLPCIFRDGSGPNGPAGGPTPPMGSGTTDPTIKKLGWEQIGRRIIHEMRSK